MNPEELAEPGLEIDDDGDWTALEHIENVPADEEIDDYEEIEAEAIVEELELI